MSSSILQFKGPHCMLILRYRFISNIKVKFKGDVFVISSQPPYKDGNAIFTTVTVKRLSKQYCGRYCRNSEFDRVCF